MTLPTLYAQFEGGWCDNCQIASKTKACPGCGQPMRPATVTVDPHDVDEVLADPRYEQEATPWGP